MPLFGILSVFQGFLLPSIFRLTSSGTVLFIFNELPQYLYFVILSFSILTRDRLVNFEMSYFIFHSHRKEIVSSYVSLSFGRRDYEANAFACVQAGQGTESDMLGGRLNQFKDIIWPPNSLAKGQRGVELIWRSDQLHLKASRRRQDLQRD